MISPEDLVMSITVNLRKSLVEDAVDVESVVKVQGPPVTFLHHEQAQLEHPLNYFCRLFV